MFDRVIFDDGGTRYVVVRASAFRYAKMPGDDQLEHVPHVELPSLLETLARRDPWLFRELCEVATGSSAPRMTVAFQMQGSARYADLNMRALLGAFGEPRGEARGAPPFFAELYMLRPATRGKPFTENRDSPENRRLDAALAQLGSSHLLLSGDSLRLLRAGTVPAHFDRAFYETVSERELFQTLPKLIAASSTTDVQKTQLGELLAAAELQRSQTGTTELLLLRQHRNYARPESKSGPALTPSQLRKAQATDWLEIAFVSDAGDPMANETYEVRLPDGSVRRGNLDANGMAYLPGIPSGSCAVSFPNFAPRVVS